MQTEKPATVDGVGAVAGQCQTVNPRQQALHTGGALWNLGVPATLQPNTGSKAGKLAQGSGEKLRCRAEWHHTSLHEDTVQLDWPKK